VRSCEEIQRRVTAYFFAQFWKTLVLQVGAQACGRPMSLAQAALGPVSTPRRLAEGQEQHRWTLLSGLGQHFVVPFASELAELRVHLIHLPFPAGCDGTRSGAL
jgi:hypothetical protein